MARQFSDSLSDLGHEVVVFTPKYSRGQKFDTHREKVEALKPILKFGNAGFIPQLFSKLRNFDMVYLHLPFFGGGEVVWLAKMLKRGKFKLAIHYHMDVRGLTFLASILRLPSLLATRFLYKQADLITCASLDYVRTSNIKEIYQNNEGKFIELPFTVDTDKYYPGKNKYINNNDIRIIFVGGLDQAHYFKGLEVLFKSLSLIKKYEWHLSVVGQGEGKEFFENKAGELGIRDRTDFLSGLGDKELIKEYQKSDFLVLPSLNSNEAFGIVLLEAMASGLPVIASDLPGVRTVFTPGKEGYLSEPSNVGDLKDNLVALINNHPKRQAMGNAARQLVEKKYSSKKLTNNLKVLCDNVANINYNS